MLDLDRKLQQLGARMLTDVEPMTTAEVLDRFGVLASPGHLELRVVSRSGRRPRRVLVTAAALPPEAVTAAERDHWIEAVLFDTPLPDGFGRESFGDRDAIMMIDGLHGLAARAAIEVTCAWSDQWFDAEETGDSASSAEAAEALSSIRTWGPFSSLDAYVVNDFARVTDAIVAGEDSFLEVPLTRETVDSALQCAAGQLAVG